MLLPRFRSIVRDGEQITLVTQCCQQHLVYVTHFDHNMLRKWADFNELRPQAPNSISPGYPRAFHRFSTGYPQLFAQGEKSVFRGFSSLFPHLLHTVFDSFSVQHSRSFFLSLFDTFPHDLTSSAGTKKGEKEANADFCGKRASFVDLAIDNSREAAPAHVLWHVEQFRSCRWIRRRRRNRHPARARFHRVWSRAGASLSRESPRYRAR